MTIDIHHRAGAVLALGLLLLAVPGRAYDEGLLDAPWRSFEVGLNPNLRPTSMAAGDLDGDGDTDVVTGLYFFGGPGVSVLLANGDGSFGEPAVYETGANFAVGDVELADIDGDRDLDILATIPDIFWFSAIVGVWRNQGDGSFGAREEFLTGFGPVGMTVGDFTGDGFPDVVTGNYDWLGSGDTVSVLAHNGLAGNQAGFLAPVDYFCGESPLTLRSADLDGDADLDLYVGREATSNAILLNEGGGIFGSPTFYPQTARTPQVTDAIELVDADLDGDVDLLAAGMDQGNPSFGVVSVRRNDGAGGFGPPEDYRLLDWSYTPANLAVGELDGDGWPDVVATTPSGRAVDGHHVLLNDGAGGFFGGGYYEDAKQPEDAVLFDADGDGDMEIVTAAGDSAVITVHDNPGDAGFQVLKRNFVGILTGGLFVRGMDHGDIDNDGDLDVVTASGDAYILRNPGDGDFAGADIYDSPIGASDVKLRDLDDDGFLDLLLNTSSAFAVALNRGDGTFDPAVVTPVPASQEGESDAYDVDGDGFLDVVKTDSGPAAVIHLARNSGNGTSFTLMNPLDTPGIPCGIEGADLNHDGHMDLVADTSSGLTTFPGNGDFTFDNFLATGYFSSCGRFVLHDVNVDGTEDLVVLAGNAGGHTSRVATLLGWGDGSFGFANEVLGPIGLESSFRISSDIDAGDIDGDGWPDVVLTSNAPDDVTVFLNAGDGTLRQPEERYGSGYSSSASSVGDFTGDGLTDVATLMSMPPSGFQDAVVLLEGRGRIYLDVAGSCPGAVTLSASGLEPGARVAFLVARGRGAATIPADKPCAGTSIGLDESYRIIGTAVADGSGIASMTGDVPAPACGRALLQIIESATCRTSVVEPL